LLLGLFREQAGPLPGALSEIGTLQSIRSEIESQITPRAQFSTAVEVPLSEESKNILKYAVDSADQLEHTRVETVHLVLGILREEQCLAAKVLRGRGLQPSDVENVVTRWAKESAGTGVATVVHAQQAILRMLEVWKERDPRKLAEFFDADGLLTDLQGDLWTGREGIERALAKLFSKLRDPAVPGKLTDLRSIRGEAWLATVTWKSPRKTKSRVPAILRLIAVISWMHGDWQIVWAHLINIPSA
jgi:uncharacterized protein (TIGR02246 family)